MSDANDTNDLWTLFGHHGRGALVTLKRDGRPQLSNVDFLADTGAADTPGTPGTPGTTGTTGTTGTAGTADTPGTTDTPGTDATATRTIRISTTDDRAKVANLRRDPRASLFVTRPDGGAYAVAEGDVELSATAADPHDSAVEELVEVYRDMRGEHPDWDEYRAAMVADRRLVVRIRVTRLYGWKP